VLVTSFTGQRRLRLDVSRSGYDAGGGEVPEHIKRDLRWDDDTIGV
jgi:hypothetical protein